jgi:isoquinoline 1-oxidoreductase alpha subunit
MTIRFRVNGEPVELDVDVDPSTPLLWVVRDVLGLKGTKYGCGIAMCGACTLHVDGEVFRSCSYPVEYAEGKEVTTIEGLSLMDADSTNLHPIQKAWMELDVPQCGYCQPGFMMAAAKLIAEIDEPSDDDIKTNISNICRCGTHPRIIKAVHRAAELRRGALAPASNSEPELDSES